MRWQPDSPVCAKCGFDWQMTRQDAIDLVAQVPGAAAAAITGINDPAQRAGERWSASMYVWHLVDVLRIGAERLLTLIHDPERGITCWDENALAEARRYQQLSPAVGLIVLRSAAEAWTRPLLWHRLISRFTILSSAAWVRLRSSAVMPMRCTTI
jgi:hypothetical protein